MVTFDNLPRCPPPPVHSILGNGVDAKLLQIGELVGVGERKEVEHVAQGNRRRQLGLQHRAQALNLKPRK